MMEFQEHWNELLASWSDHKTMVLSTCEQNYVTSRMMSVVRMGSDWYFQTDCTFRKYRQLKNNPNASLCFDNVQLEGVCTEVGKPENHKEFCQLFKQYFKGSYQSYSCLKNERLFQFEPTWVKRWMYVDGIAYEEIFDVSNQRYEIKKYEGE